MLRLLSWFWLVCALVAWARGEPRIEFLFCLLMCAIVNVAAEVYATRKAIEALGAAE